jgi:phytoene synthase
VRTEDQIFKDGSTTYYWSSRFFSPQIKADVLKLYSFVRVADNFVDAVPQDIKSFNKLEKQWQSKKVSKARTELNLAAKNMIEVDERYNFDTKWTDAFLDSMRMDTKAILYKKQKDTLKYIYGSAEVIGLMMLSILRPDLREGDEAKKVQHYAELQGRAMQYINFIRDINEDYELGRCYFAKKELEFYGLSDLSPNTVRRHPADFREFIHAQIKLYNEWQTEANNGFHFIPWRERIALRTAVDMYNWTAQKIAADPFIVYEKKVKPSKLRVISRALLRCIYA